MEQLQDGEKFAEHRAKLGRNFKRCLPVEMPDATERPTNAALEAAYSAAYGFAAEPGAIIKATNPLVAERYEKLSNGSWEIVQIMIQAN